MALTREAIRWARMLPDDGEVTGLLALMLLTDARRTARTTGDGGLVPLAEQDRTRWDHARLGVYQVEAATDWAQVVALVLCGLDERMAGHHRRTCWRSPGTGWRRERSTTPRRG